MGKITPFFLVVFLFFQGCEMVSMSKSERKNAVVKSFNPVPDISVSSTGAVNVSGLVKAHFFPAGFRIESKGSVIYIDPFLIDDPKPADLVFITHEYMDHFSIQDIEKIVKPDTLIVCPNSVAQKLGQYRIKEASPGDTFQVKKIKCEVVAAYNLKPGFLWMYLHAKTDKKVGYIIDIGGVRIYHAGDTDRIPEMNAMKDIDIALVPIGTGKTAMNPGQAAALINDMKPKAVIPMHYEIGKGAVQEFRKLVAKNIEIVLLQPGE